MKKITALTAIILVCSLLFALSGCEVSVNLDKDSTTVAGNLNATTEPATAVIEVTDEEGSVISTETVTLSDEGKGISDNFFDKKPDNNVETGVSQDRVQQAIANQNPSSGKNDSSSQNNGNNNSGNNANNSGNNGSSSDAETPYVQDDLAVLNSSQYMTVIRIEGKEGVSTYKIARKGKTSCMMFDYDGQSLGLIIDEKNVYLLSVAEKTYVQVSKELILENATDEEMKELLKGNPLEIERKIAKTYTEDIDGITYNVVEYTNGYKDYLIGKTIIKTVAKDGSAMYYDSVSAVAPASLFVPPADYKLTDLSSPEVSEFVGDIAEATESTDLSNDNA